MVGGTHLIRRLGVLERLRIPVETLANFLDVVEARYHASNPFHNALHATDTLFTLQVRVRLRGRDSPLVRVGARVRVRFIVTRSSRCR